MSIISLIESYIYVYDNVEAVIKNLFCMCTFCQDPFSDICTRMQNRTNHIPLPWAFVIYGWALSVSVTIGIDFGAQPGHVPPPLIEKRRWFNHLLPHFSTS